MAESGISYRYLYDLEKYIYRPDFDYTKFKYGTSDNHRIQLIDWLFDVCKSMNLSFRVFPLAVTIFDTYICLYIKYNGNSVIIGDLQCVGCTCLHLACGILEMYPPEIRDFEYISDSALTKEQLLKFQRDVINKLDGQLVRSSQMFFTHKKPISNETSSEDELQNIFLLLLRLSYWSSDLMAYPPSLVYQTCYYLIYTRHENEFHHRKYTYEQMSTTCSIITNLIRNMVHKKNTYSKATSDRAGTVLKYVEKSGCSKDPTSPWNSITTNYMPAPKITNFKVENKVGEGSFAAVSRATYKGDVLAVKHFNEQPALVEMTILELLKLSKDKSCSESIIVLKGFLTDSKEKVEGFSSIYIFIEYGQFNLQEAVLKKRINFSDEVLQKYFRELAMGLWCMEFNDVIHGDIKPPNIVWVGDATGGGHFKFIDFGSSLPYSSFQVKQFEFGTPTYRAPEIWMKYPNFSYKVDIWSIGLVFWFMITGRDLMLSGLASKFLNLAMDDEEVLDTISQIFGSPTINGFTSKIPYPKNIVPNEKYLRDNLREFYDIVEPCLRTDLDRRLNADRLLSHYLF